MGTIFYNNIPLSTINPYTLLFHEHSLNIQFNSTQQFKTFPIMLFSFIFLYALTTFIYIILTSHNYSEGILITTTVIISLLCLIVSLCIKFKKNCFTIKNERSVELLLLTVIFILFTLINQIFCAHLKHFTNNYYSLIETIFVNLEIICKCLWTVLNVNEFVYVFFGTVINCVIIVPYNYMRLLTLFSLIIVFSVQGLYAYFFTKLRKEMFIQEKMNVDMKTNDILGLGYATMYMNVNDNNKVKKLNENEILNDSIVNENSYLKNMFYNACEDKENLFSLLNEVEDINDEIKKCLLYCLNYQTEQIQLIEKEKEKINQNNRNSFKLSISNSGNTLIQTTNENNNSFNKAHHKIENSLTNLVSKVSHNFQLISNNKYDNVKTGKSRTFEPQITKKFGCSSGTATFNSQIPSVDIHPKYTFQLPEFHKRKNKQLISDDDGDKGIPIPVQETKENQINEINTKKLNESINDSYFLLPLLFSTGLNRFLKQDEFIYLGRKRINTKSLKTQPLDITMSNIKSSNKQLPIIKNSFDLSLSSPTDFSFYKIYFRFNAILSGLEFLFLDESKNQFENLFKSYSRQVSMYLHDFKNPLTAINEKIIDYKEIFQSILVESKDEQMGMFKFGKSELDDMVFLSITSEDCLGMIKSYEDFSKAFANNNETMTLNLSSFYLSEITTYLSEWINIKNQRTHQDIEFIVNDLTLSKRFKLYTDKLKLKQILINIISNSYKFTKNGDITLTITREIINSKQYTKFHIRDTGDGMDKFTMKNLFNPFFSKNGGNKNKEGCGLGLVLSMRMSKNLGLPIEVESEENKGTSMWFYIEEKEKEKIEGSENCNKTNNEEYEDNIDDNIDDNNDNNNNNIGTLINSVVGEDEDDLSLSKKKNALYNNNLNKSESNLDFIPLTFNDSKAQNTTIVEDSSCSKSKNNLNSSINTKEKPNRYKKLNSFQSTETILCDNIMKIDPKEKGFPQIPKMFISMSPQRPTTMNLVLPDSHKLSSSIQNSFNYSSIKKNLKRHKFQSSFEDTAFFGLSIIKQEITMSILGKPPLSDLNLISSQNNIANNTNHYPNFPFHNSTTSQIFLNNNYTLNTTNNNQSVNNVNLGFGFCKKGTVSTLWTKNFCKTKGSSNFFNVKSLLSKKDTKTTNAFSDLGVKREKTISVLLVDDDENFQRAHKRLLEKLNIDEVVSVYDGIDLMMMFLRNELTSFDLIILDNFMTYLHGTEVVKIIKFMKDSEMGSKGGFDFTVLNKIFISTGAQDIAMSSLEQFDTVDFIAKPICKNDMENIIRKVLAGVK